MKIQVKLSILIILMIFLIGCSVRPQKKTVILDDMIKSNHTINTPEISNFKLDSIKIIPLENEDNDNILLGWRGKDILLYDQRGIYLFDYMNATKTPLATYDNETIIRASLSKNYQKISYETIDINDKLTLYISDADFTSNSKKIDLQSNNMPGIELNGSVYLYSNLIWSNNNTYVTTTSNQIIELTSEAEVNIINIPQLNITEILAINDDTDQILSNNYLERLTSFSIESLLDKKPSFRLLDSKLYVLKADFFAKNGILYLAHNNLYLVMDEDITKTKTFYDVSDYAISPDKKYICFTKTSKDSTCDIYIGRLNNSEIEDIELIYKGFIPRFNEIFIAPNNKKICLVGYENNSKEPNIMILTFK